MTRYSHIGLPTTEERDWAGYYEPGRIHYTDFGHSEFGIEWLRFEPDSPMPDLMKTQPHIACLVDDIDAALEGREILVETFSPAEGVKVAFIVSDGAPVEFMEIAEPA